MKCLKTLSLLLFIFSFSYSFGQTEITDNTTNSATANIQTDDKEGLNATFAGISTGGSALICDLTTSSGLKVTEENGWELNRSYTLSVGNKEKSVSVSYPGRELPSEAIVLIESLKSGDTLHIENIEAENIYGVAVPIPNLIIHVTQCK